MLKQHELDSGSEDEVWLSSLVNRVQAMTGSDSSSAPQPESRSASVVNAAGPSESAPKVPRVDSQKRPADSRDLRGSVKHPRPAPQTPSSPEVEDPIIALWHHYIFEQLVAYRDRLGIQVRPIRIASVCSGMNPEVFVAGLSGLDVEHVWSCAPKESCWRFISSNNLLAQHAFMDLREITTNNAGSCRIHPKCKCVIEMPAFIDLLVSGVSCRPYSLARSGRMSVGDDDHMDRDLVLAWVEGVKKWEPNVAIFENVWGMTMRSLKRNTPSPLRQLLDLIKVELPQYACKPFIANSCLWLVWDRRRVWLVLVHMRAGGQNSLDRIEKMLKDLRRREVRVCDDFSLIITREDLGAALES